MRILIFLFTLMLVASLTHAQAPAKPAGIPPRAMFAGKTGGEIKKKELLKAAKLTAMDSTLTITDFMMDIGTQEIMGKGNQLNDEMRKAITKAVPGTRMNLEHVVAVDPAGKTVYLVPISFTIK